jgi:prophage regulatory protein
LVFDANRFVFDAMERPGVVPMSRKAVPEDIPPTPGESRVMRRAEVEKKTGIKRAHIYRLMRAGQFPKRLRIGVRAVGWDSVEVEQWIAARRKDRPAP